MKVNFHLRRRSEAAPATALLLPSQQPGELLRLCAGLGLDPLPEVHAVAGAFLLKLPRPATASVPGTIALRRLADNLLLPADAELVPGLLDDEAAALTARRGLIFLPGGRVLEFTPGQPLSLAAVLTTPPVHRRSWQPLPEPPELAERITEIVFDHPEAPPDDLLEAGGEGIGTEAPRPDDAGLGSTLMGKASLGLGKGMAWLGHALGMEGLRRAGADWANRALSMAPRLSEALLGAQEAALRALLRDFREGNVERALRRALPIRGDTGRGARPAGSARLPTHETSYSLKNILGGGGGPASVWFNASDVYRELEREYRLLAERAARDGDFRRAAFIYGKLLGDYRSAANVLSQGGLHHDAAILYEAKLGDHLAAARSFEAAGMFDRSLKIYRDRGEHERAADLLRRIGEEEQAVAEYRLGAEKIVATGRGHYQAGEMLLKRAGLRDLAQEYYAAGWGRRPADSAVPCAIRLAQLHAQDAAADRLLGLLDEAGPFLQGPGIDGPAAEFYHEVAALADQPALAPLREELRDRALMALAGRMRQRLPGERRSVELASTLLGRSPAWSPAVVSDARFALRATPWRPAPAPVPAAGQVVPLVPPGTTVTAVCQAWESGDVFVGLENSEVVCYRPATGEVLAVDSRAHPVAGLATNASGDAVAVLHPLPPEEGYLGSLFRKEGGYERSASLVIRDPEAWVAPVLLGEDAPMVALWEWGRLWFLSRSLVPEKGLALTASDLEPWTALVFPALACGVGEWAVLAFERDRVLYYPRSRHKEMFQEKALGWGAGLPPGSTLKRPPLSWLRRGTGALELAGLSPGGTLYWSELVFEDGILAEVKTAALTSALPCLAAAVVRPGLVVAVSRTGVHSFSAGPGLRPRDRIDIALPSALACFPYHPTHELLVVCGDGTLVRVPMPG